MAFVSIHARNSRRRLVRGSIIFLIVTFFTLFSLGSWSSVSRRLLSMLKTDTSNRAHESMAHEPAGTSATTALLKLHLNGPTRLMRRAHILADVASTSNNKGPDANIDINVTPPWKNTNRKEEKAHGPHFPSSPLTRPLMGIVISGTVSSPLSTSLRMGTAKTSSQSNENMNSDQLPAPRSTQFIVADMDDDVAANDPRHDSYALTSAVESPQFIASDMDDDAAANAHPYEYYALTSVVESPRSIVSDMDDDAAANDHHYKDGTLERDPLVSSAEPPTKSKETANDQSDSSGGGRYSPSWVWSGSFSLFVSIIGLFGSFTMLLESIARWEHRRRQASAAYDIAYTTTSATVPGSTMPEGTYISATLPPSPRRRPTGYKGTTVNNESRHHRYTGGKRSSGSSYGTMMTAMASIPEPAELEIEDQSYNYEPPRSYSNDIMNL